MKKKLIGFLTVLCMTIGMTACGSTDSNTEVSSQPSTETDSEVSSQPSTEADTTVESEVSQEPEKVYDVYVNGVGYDKGVTLEFEITLTAPDTEFASCCPSFNIFMEGVTDAEQIEQTVDFSSNDSSINPLLINNVASPDYDNEYYSYWGYFDLLALWDAPDGDPLDITNGLVIYAPRITFNEAGNYTVSVTSGNGAEEMKETFAKYDNCFTFTTKIVTVKENEL